MTESGPVMIRASLNGVTVAEAERTVIVEGNHCFPPESVRFEHLSRSRMKTLCFWKGVASYYTVNVDGAAVAHGAWTYRHPSPLARRIKDHVAFTAGVTVDTTGSHAEPAQPDPLPTRDPS